MWPNHDAIYSEFWHDVRITHLRRVERPVRKVGALAVVRFKLFFERKAADRRGAVERLAEVRHERRRVDRLRRTQRNVQRTTACNMHSAQHATCDMRSMQHTVLRSNCNRVVTCSLLASLAAGMYLRYAYEYMTKIGRNTMMNNGEMMHT